jgi:hypothetical protein
MRTLQLEPYVDQLARWPLTGHHILAQADSETVVVYQAYRPSIGLFAAEAQHFGGGGFSLERMSWIKPNFLWMMYRCGWAAKEGQEVVLAIWLARAGFEQILGGAVPSSYDRERYATRDEWSRAVKRSSVRVQWDPDHAPSGAPVERRAIQLGLRGDVLARYAREWIVEIQDISVQVRAMKQALDRGGVAALECPREHVYPVTGRV